MTRITCMSFALFAAALGLSCARQEGLAADERVIFFPTSAYQDSVRHVWIVPIHGWVFEPERDDAARKAALAAFRLALDLNPGDANTARFENVASSFLVDNERGKNLRIRLAG